MLDPRKLPEGPALMIAGPGQLYDEDLEALGRQVIAHYGDVWVGVHNHVLESLGALLGATQLPYLIPGTGTTGLDAAVMNLFEAGQRVVVAKTGFFGTRLMEIARAHRLEVTEVEVEIGEPIDPSKIEEAASNANGILTVHVDTSTGVRHPIEEIAAVARRTGAIYMVDGIASVGGEMVDIDGWGIDALVTGTQKGLEAPPGLAIVALGEGGRARVEARSERPLSWYLDLKTWDRYRDEWGAWHPHPVTMPSPLILALASSLDRIAKKGLAAVVGERASLAESLRVGLRDLGLAAVPKEGFEANLVVAAYAPDPTSIQKHLLDQGIMISGGLEPLGGKTIRVGLMGKTATPEMVERVLQGIAEAVSQ
ncbi:MAG: aminotransferase class V-fold PLP-dependent enzyme [Actinobacteria bacterium]|nr:aminotransferase class V-fold PLP-dependent enzyme [Actinomycetota bacterium]